MSYPLPSSPVESTTKVLKAEKSFIHPPSSLLIEVTDPHTQHPGYAFPMQTKAWLKMQPVVRTALSFPIDKNSFLELYGEFTDEASVLSAVEILKNIKLTATDYGDPRTLISNIVKFQEADTVPDSIYGNAVWLAYRTQTTAQQISGLLNEGLSMIGEEPNPEKRIEYLKELLIGQGGITELADDLKKQIQCFSCKVSNFQGNLNSKLIGLQSYLSQSDDILSEAREDVSEDITAIDKLNKDIDHLNDEYTGFTAAASASPAFLLVPLAGPYLAVADAATFTALALKVKSELKDQQNELENKTDDERKKMALVVMLTNFNVSTQNVEKDGEAFINSLGSMISGWTEFNAQIELRLSTLTVNDVENWSAFQDRLNIKPALTAWNLIASKAEDFAQAGFIKFSEAQS